MNRQEFLTAALGAVSSAALFGAAPESFETVERRTGGRLGVAAIDTGTGRRITYRANERFPMCSTFKVLAAAAVLARVDRGHEYLTRRVAYGKSDLLDWAPVTRKHVSQGYMMLGELCASAIEYSDNTAANLLLRELGGPRAVTAFARSIGDRYTRLDRIEPALNSGIPGDPRDTTTPAAMASDVRSIAAGNALSHASRRTLQAWLIACRTGEDLLRAGLPPSWRVGDKTGLGGPNNTFGDSDTRNDVAVAWPSKRPPIVIAAYLTGCKLHPKERDGVLASVGKIVGYAVSTHSPAGFGGAM